MQYTDAIEKTLRYLQPRPPMQCRVYSNYTAGSGALVVNELDPAYLAVRPGTILEVGTNILYVIGVSGSTLTVQGGYQGSTDANASAGALISINPRFTRFGISQAINDEIYSLSAPTLGVGQIETVQLTYIPTFDGYDLGSGFDSATSKVLGITYKHVPPDKRHPVIRTGDYRVIRDNVDGDFPSGNGIQFNNDGYGERAQPGFPITVVYLAAYSPLVNLTDDLLTVGGITLPCQDIVVWGAAIREGAPREIQRNTMGTQQDPRKATEVPAGAMAASLNVIAKLRQDRINQEAGRITRRYPNAEWR